MLANDLLSIFIAPLHRTGVPYMVTGSVAAMLYGEPRMTNDIDLVVDMQPDSIEAVLGEFPPEEFYRPPVEVIGAEIARRHRGHLNLIHHASGYKADIYLHGDDPLHRWGMENKRTVEIDRLPVSLAPAEYVIVRKLEYFREGGYQKHRLDIEAMLRLSGQNISLDIIDRWVRTLSLEKEWNTILGK